MHLIVHREIPDDENLRSQWNDLIQQMERPEVFYTYEWALAVNRAYRASVKPLLLLAYEGESLVGLVALATAGESGKTFFLTSATADYCDFVCARERRRELVDAVLAELRRREMPELVLANLPADSVTLGALKAGARYQGYVLFSRPGYLCAQVVLGSAEQRKLVKQSARRKNVRRSVSTMEKTAPVTFSHLRGGEEIIGLLPRFSKAHVARFLATDRISNLARQERREFLDELAKQLSWAGWITLSRLMVGDQPIAWNYGFQFGGSWFWYQPTFDSSWQQLSPGFCLLSKIVEEACDAPEIDCVDLGLGAEGYKDRFSTSNRQTLHVTATTSKSVYLKESVRYYVATAIQSVPLLETRVRRALRVVTSLRKHGRETGVWNLFRTSWSRARKRLFGETNVMFFEWPGGIFNVAPAFGGCVLRALDLDLLALAAMHHVDEPETLTYLLRAADRLGSGESRGFALVTAEGVPVHFCWASKFEDFHVLGLNHTLKGPSADSTLLFDCWTPASARGRGYCGMAISRVASQLWTEGKQPWILSAATSGSVVRGIQKAGFAHRFSLTRKRFLFTGKVVESQPHIIIEPFANSSAAD